jgi:hypothetical protein
MFLPLAESPPIKSAALTANQGSSEHQSNKVLPPRATHGNRVQERASWRSHLVKEGTK